MAALQANHSMIAISDFPLSFFIARFSFALQWKLLLCRPHICRIVPHTSLEKLQEKNRWSLASIPLWQSLEVPSWIRPHALSRSSVGSLLRTVIQEIIPCFGIAKVVHINLCQSFFSCFGLISSQTIAAWNLLPECFHTSLPFLITMKFLAKSRNCMIFRQFQLQPVEIGSCHILLPLSTYASIQAIHNDPALVNIDQIFCRIQALFQLEMSLSPNPPSLFG